MASDVEEKARLDRIERAQEKFRSMKRGWKEPAQSSDDNDSKSDDRDEPCVQKSDGNESEDDKHSPEQSPTKS